MSSNPNPQSVAFAAFEAPTLKVTMSPPTNISGWTLQLNIRRSYASMPPLLIADMTPTIIDAATGVFSFSLTSLQAGVTLGPGSYACDIWRTDSGNEKRLVVVSLTVKTEQWK